MGNAGQHFPQLLTRSRTSCRPDSSLQYFGIFGRGAHRPAATPARSELPQFLQSKEPRKGLGLALVGRGSLAASLRVLLQVQSVD